MIYPDFLSPEKTVGITALSAGVGDKLESFDFSLENIRKRGYKIKETASVRNSGIVSADAKTRAEEFHALLKDKETDYILFAAGGEFLMEMLPYTDFDLIKHNPKWLQGYSDITNILYPVTTILDIATVYSLNAGGFDRAPLHEYQKNALSVMQGEIPLQQSYSLTCDFKTRDGEYTIPVEYKAVNGDFTAKGRLLGGCLDCLCETIAGTRFDGTEDFINRYRDDGIIWYFDVFSMSPESVCRGLWRLNELNWFENASAFIFGRVMFPAEFTQMTYEEAVRRALGTTAKIVTDADVGHLPPSMTVINGAMGEFEIKNKKATLKMEIK